MSKKRIAKKLLKYGESLDDWVRPIEGKRKFTLQRANSFLVGVLLDRQIDAERAWEAADWIVESIGNGEQDFWAATRKANKPNLEGFMRYGWGGKAFHRHWRTMSKNLQGCADIIIEKYEGDPRQIWNYQRCVPEVRDRFEEFPGIGKALSRMAVLILVRNNGLIDGKKSLPKLDVKPDDLRKRVFERAGLVSSNPSFNDFLEAARQLKPDFPAALDAPTWDIGREFCTPHNPQCGDCPLDKVCPKIGL